MPVATRVQKFTRSFPEAREFLLTEVVGPDYPVKHLIEQARNKGHITKGKRGRGGGVVTSRDMAMLLAGILTGDTPQAATDAMPLLFRFQSNTQGIETDQLKSFPLKDGWWKLSFIEVIAQYIDAWRNDFHFGFDEMSITVIREPLVYSRITWNILPYERDNFLTFEISGNRKKNVDFNGCRNISASFPGQVFRNAADWLEGREGHK